MWPRHLNQSSLSDGGTLFTFGVNEARLGRSGGDNSIPEVALPKLKVVSIGASRHSVISTLEGNIWTMGHNDSKGGGGHGSPPLDASGQLGRGGTREAGRVFIEVSTTGQRRDPGGGEGSHRGEDNWKRRL